MHSSTVRRSMLRRWLATGARAACLWALFASAAQAERATVAVAANFAEAARALQDAFEKQSAHTVVFAFGSTGKLYAQIVNGAPFDAFLSADQSRPELLERDGDRGVAGSRFTYAIGQLTLWSADPDLLAEGAPDLLRSAAVRHLAIANPDLAPYGLAARQALQRLGLWESVEPRVVMGQDAGETYAMVATGNAQAGLVALSSVLGARGRVAGSRWDIPNALHDPIRQDAILLAGGVDNVAAAAFLAFLRSASATALIERFGYAGE